MDCEQLIIMGIVIMICICLYNKLCNKSERFTVSGKSKFPQKPVNGNTRNRNNGNKLNGNGNGNGNRNGNGNGTGNGTGNTRNAKGGNKNSNGILPSNIVKPKAVEGGAIFASEEGNNEINPNVNFKLGCSIPNKLTAEDLLPKDDKTLNFKDEHPNVEGNLKNINFLTAGYQIGVNTVGTSLRNANQQIRSEPPNPQVAVSPWMMSTIGPDTLRKPLEICESECTA